MRAPGAAGVTAPSGILLVDKPTGWTSHDVVARTRRLAGTRKVGHAGTLDPMATGLLLLGIGSATRLLTYLVGVDKEYAATIRLGAATTTDDAEGEPGQAASPAALAAVEPESIAEAIAGLTGAIRQVPSAVSAIKADGKRAYARVRAGEDVCLAARPVTVSAFELLGSELVPGADDRLWLDLTVRVECSSGTYIRALARDLGAALGVGGHLTALRRTRIGPFLVADAAPLDGLDVASRLLAPAAAASAVLGRFELTDEQAVDLGHGKRISAVDVLENRPLAAVARNERLVGIVEFHGSPGSHESPGPHEVLGRSLVNFPTDQAAS